MKAQIEQSLQAASNSTGQLLNISQQVETRVADLKREVVRTGQGMREARRNLMEVRRRIFLDVTRDGQINPPAPSASSQLQSSASGASGEGNHWGGNNPFADALIRSGDDFLPSYAEATAHEANETRR